MHNKMPNETFIAVQTFTTTASITKSVGKSADGSYELQKECTCLYREVTIAHIQKAIAKYNQETDNDYIFNDLYLSPHKIRPRQTTRKFRTKTGQNQRYTDINRRTMGVKRALRRSVPNRYR